MYNFAKKNHCQIYIKNLWSITSKYNLTYRWSAGKPHLDASWIFTTLQRSAGLLHEHSSQFRAGHHNNIFVTFLCAKTIINITRLAQWPIVGLNANVLNDKRWHMSLYSSVLQTQSNSCCNISFAQTYSAHSWDQNCVNFGYVLYERPQGWRHSIIIFDFNFWTFWCHTCSGEGHKQVHIREIKIV